MPVVKDEIEKLANAGGWRNKDQTISRIIEQSKGKSPNKKNVTNYGRHVDGKLNNEIVDVNGLSEMDVLSTGTFYNTLENGEKIEINIDKMMLDEICTTMSSYTPKVYVGHQFTHKDHIGYLGNLRVDTDEQGKSHLKGTVLYPTNGVDEKLQKGVIEGIKEQKITKASASVAFTASTLSDNNDYITNMYIPELSIIPPLGYKLEDDSGTKSVNNLVPLSDSHIVAFKFSEGKMELFEDASHNVLLNINGNAIGKINASSLSKILVDINNNDDYVDETGCMPEDVDEEKIKAYEKVGEFTLEKVKDNEFKVLGMKKDVFIKVNKDTLSMSTTPHAVRYINKLVQNLSEYEKKYVKVC